MLHASELQNLSISEYGSFCNKSSGCKIKNCWGSAWDVFEDLFTLSSNKPFPFYSQGLVQFFVTFGDNLQ